MKFPKYAEKFILPHIRKGTLQDNELAHKHGFWGYAFRIYRKDNYMWWGTFKDYANRFIKFCERNHAAAGILEEVGFTKKEHGKPFYKRDYIVVYISDPMALRIEKYMQEGSRCVI